nr:reverse transcriptase domain-containing protein [Tanacetum cinerariifolium]
MADTRTMSELLEAPTEGYGDLIVIPAILAEYFELKVGLFSLVTLSQFHGFERDGPHSHICWFNKITYMLKYKNVPHDAIKLMLFLFSLEGAAQTWLEKEPPRSIHTWQDLVYKFVNYFFPPSNTTNLKNGITNFQQRFDDMFSEAWDRFKDLLRKRPHHGFSELHQINTFYNALTQFDQDSLSAEADGNHLNLSTTTSSPSPSLDVNALSEIIKELLLNIKATQQATVKTIKETCVTYGGPHPYYECLATDNNTFNASTAMSTYNQGGTLDSTYFVFSPRGSGMRTRGDEGQGENYNFTDALLHMPKFAYTFKSLLSNKEKLFELESTALNEISLAVLLKKFPKKLGDPGKFLIPCDFPELEECLALADLGASINLMPLFVWKKISLPELTPTRMTLKLANRSVAYFSVDFVVVDYDVDPWVPLILGRPILRTSQVLIDVHGEELTLRDNDEAITFKFVHTSRYSRNYYEEF